MTLNELSQLTGESVSDCYFTLKLLLKYTSPDLVVKVIQNEFNNVSNSIEILRKEGAILTIDGRDVPKFKYSDRETYQLAHNLICRRNRLMHMLYH